MLLGICSFFVLVAFRCAICCRERMLDFGGCVGPVWLVSHLIPSTSFMPSTVVRSASAVYKTMICKSCGWKDKSVVRCGVSVCPEMFEDWLDMTWLENTVCYYMHIYISKTLKWSYGPKFLIENPGDGTCKWLMSVCYEMCLSHRMQGPFSCDPSESAFFSVPAFDIYLGGILRPVMRMMIMYDQCCLHRGSLGFVLTDMLQLPLSFLWCCQWFLITFDIFWQSWQSWPLLF